MRRLLIAAWAALFVSACTGGADTGGSDTGGGTDIDQEVAERVEVDEVAEPIRVDDVTFGHRRRSPRNRDSPLGQQGRAAYIEGEELPGFRSVTT